MSLLPIETTSLRDLEADLTSSLIETIEEIDHAESLDAEQRAEVHTILRAMLTDAVKHRALLEHWLARAAERGGDV